MRPLSYIRHLYDRFYLSMLKCRGKASCPNDFSAERYLCAYPDVNESKQDPVLHYLLRGRKENRIAYKTFDMGELKKQTTNERPLISIIVASYNYQDLITETLDSILRQTYENFEIIVVDDGSKDDSVKVIQEYAAKSDKIHLYQHPNGENRGLVATIQLGVQHAKGEYVAFCESDDYWAPANLEKKIEYLNKYDNVAIIANKVKLFGDPKTVKERGDYLIFLDKLLLKGGTPIDIRYNERTCYIPTFSCVMIKKDILASLDYSSPIPAWIDFWLYKQILKDHLLYYVDEELTFWRQHNSYNSPEKSAEYTKKYDLFIRKINQLLQIES